MDCETREVSILRTSQIAAKTGRGLRSVQRALKDLRAAKYLEIDYERSCVNGQHTCLTHIRITEKLFKDLQISHHHVQLSAHYKRKSNEKRSRVMPSWFNKFRHKDKKKEETKKSSALPKPASGKENANLIKEMFGSNAPLSPVLQRALRLMTKT